MRPEEILLLGLIQGLTEFLPISSSGHLVLAKAILGIREPGILAEVVLHVGTALAAMIYFRRDLWGMARALGAGASEASNTTGREARRLALWLLVASVPAALVGFAAGGKIEGLFDDPRVASWGLLATAAVLFSTLVVRRGASSVSARSAIAIGCCQAIALLPGISRSGMTIAGGLCAGVRPEETARFSFILAIPAILGAAGLELAQSRANLQGVGFTLLLGLGVSFLVGYLSIAVLMRIVRKGRFGWFGLYCFAAGVTGLLVVR